MKETEKNKSALVIFSGELTKSRKKIFHRFDIIVAPVKLQSEIESLGYTWINLDDFVEPGSIYEASAFAQELSQMVLPNKTPLKKAVIYRGFDLWWLNYQNLFTRFCLPYTQYKKLLIFLREYKRVTLCDASFGSLFSCYLRAHDVEVARVHLQRSSMRRLLPVGIVVQIVLTLVSIPLLAIQRRSILVATGDKFEMGKDHDFRMKFAYEKLREKNVSFIECIRSLEPTRVILQHAWKRKRPVVYTEAVTFVARFVSIVCGGQRRARREFGDDLFSGISNREERFKMFVGVQYLFSSYDDIYAMRIMEWIIRGIGVRAGFIPATTERNFQTVLGCKLAGVPTVGILHGVASRHYNHYEFMPGFDGERRLSVDRYGVWSEWWKEYFEKYSNAYGAEQLFVSGPMRPVQRAQQNVDLVTGQHITTKIKVLFVSEVVAIPTEVIPYLDALMQLDDVSVYIKFRASHDSFETWIMNNRPDILEKLGSERILKGTMQEAIATCDVAVGTQSTGVIEASIQDKPFVYFHTKKWGDYFDAVSFSEQYHFFAQTPALLVTYVRESREIPVEVLRVFRERFFGDPQKNGSAWAIEQAIAYCEGK